MNPNMNMNNVCSSNFIRKRFSLNHKSKLKCILIVQKNRVVLFF